MAFFIPTDGNWTSLIKDVTQDREWKILIDTDDDDDLDDVTDQVYNNTVSGGQRKGTTGAQWSVRLRNSQQTYAEGDLAGAICQIQARVATENYITVFTGYVSEEGCVRDKRSLTEDTVTVTMHDLIRSKATRRKTDAAIYSGFDICDTASTATSLVHVLAAMMGLEEANLDVVSIDHAVAHVALDGKSTAWKELQRIAEQYQADLYPRYDGKLRLVSRFETGFSEPTSEWTFATGGEDANVHTPWSGSLRPKSCTRAETVYDEYEDLGAKTVYKNTDEWNSLLERNAIVVAAGAYWPGPNAGDKAQLKYRDKDTGEDYPLVTDLTTPTIGVTGAGVEIECTGGLLTLVSFNGSTADTQQNPDSSEIILLNDTGSPITITKLELEADHAYRVKANNTVKAIDATVTDEADHVDLTLDGKYVSSQAQAHESCSYEVEWGKTPRAFYSLTVDWLPQIQKGALVTFSITEESRSIEGYVEEFTHISSGSMAKAKTQVSIILKQEYSYSGTPRVVVQSLPDTRPHVDATDTAISDAQDAADAAQGDATQALSDAATAQSAAEAAQGTADAKPEVYIQASQPADVPDGTIWFDSDDGNHPYVIIDGTPTDATPLQIGAIATAMLADGAVTAVKQADDSITSAKLDMANWLSGGTEGLVAYWSLNDAGLDTTGFVHKDNSGAGHDAVAAAQLAAAEGPAGPTVDLTGAALQYLTVPDHADLQFGTGDFSLEFLVQFDIADAPANEYLLDKRDAGAVKGILIIRSASTEKINFSVPNVIGTSWSTISSDAGITDIASYHQVVCQRSSGVIEMWIDGAKQAATLANTTTVSDGTYNLRIGASWSGSNRLDGKMGHIHAFSRALSESEIRFLYANPAGNIPAMILAHLVGAKQIFAEHIDVAGLITAGSLIVSGDDVSDLNNDSGYQIASDVSSAISSFAGTLGDLALEDVVGLALLDETVIDGGLILTSLLDADAIIAEVAVIDAAFIALLQAVNILFTKAVGSQSKATPAEGDERAYLGKDPTGSQTETDPVEIAFKNYVSSVWETLYRVAFKTIESDIKVAVMKLVGRAGIGGDEDDYHALKVHGDTLVDGLVRESYHDYVQLEKPDDFVWTPPVTIHTDGKRNYSHDFDIEDYRPSLAGTTYYVDPDGDDGNTGLTRALPFATIAAALDEGDAARIILKGGTYLYGTLDGYPDGIAQDLILEAHPGEVATISMHKEYAWTKTGGYTNVYHVSESDPISAWCFDAGVIDAYGNYAQLEVAAGVSACDATPGSFYHNTGTNVLYVHTADSRAADADLRLFISTTNLAVTGPYELFLKNVIFEGGDTGALRLNDDAGGSPDLYAFRCQFNYSSDGAGGLDCRGAGNVFLHRCRAIHNNQDGLNYHEALTDDTRVLEIECVGTDNGESSADNDQGSTLHDGLVGVRINGLYIRNWGQGVADITAGTQAWNIGCVAGDSVTTVDEELNASWCAFVGAEMWLVGCRAYGSKYDIRVEDTSIVYVTNCELQRAAKIVDSGIIKRFDFREETGDHSAGVPYNFQVPGTIYPQRGLILNSFLATDSASAGEVYNAFDATIYDVILTRTHAQGSIDIGSGWVTVYMITRYDSSTFRVYYNGGYVAVTVAATGGKWYLSW